MDFEDFISKRWPDPASTSPRALQPPATSHALPAHPPLPLDAAPFALEGALVEERMLFTLVELSRACGCDRAQVCELVDEGVIAPVGDEPQQWRFEGSALRRVRTAARLSQDLELSLAATALVLDLLDEIDALRAEARRHGTQAPRGAAVALGAYSRAL